MAYSTVWDSYMSPVPDSYPDKRYRIEHNRNVEDLLSVLRALEIYENCD